MLDLASPKRARPSLRRMAVIAAAILVVVVGAGSVVYAIRSVGRFREGTRTAEGRTMVRALARAAAECAGGAALDDGGVAPWRGLPPSSAPVPASLAPLRGQKYQSTPADWNAEPWICMKFAVDQPQYFQYKWTKTSDTTGTAESSADLDGDGAIDEAYAQAVHCAADHDGMQVVCDWSSPLLEK